MSKKTPKTKKKHKGLIIFLVIFSILVVFPVGFIFGAFYTTDTKQVSNSELTYQNIVSEAFYNGVENLSKEDPKLRFTIDEDMFDGILMGACEKIGQPQYIPKMYCYIKDNNYTFVVDLQASFFKSRIQIHTSISKEGDTLVFKINGITLGRLPIPLNWITSILGNFINDEMLNNAFDKAGFHLKSHLSETKLTYNREDFKTDVAKYVSDLGGDNPFLNIMLSMFGDESVLTTEYSNGIGVSLNLKKLSLEESPYKDPAPLKFDEKQLDKHKAQIVAWLNNETLKEEKVAEMFAYLIRGYDEGTKGYIDNIDSKLKEEVYTYLQPVSESIEEYKGTNTIDEELNEKPFKERCVETIKCDFIPKVEQGVDSYTVSASFTIDSNDLNSYMAFTMTEAIGKTIPITYVDENDTWKFEYVFVDNMYVGFEDEEDNPKMVIYLQLNISNKFDVTMTAAANNIVIEGTEPDTLKIGNLSLELQDINFGGISISDSELKNYILDLLPSNPEVEFFTYSNNHLLINLDEIAGGTQAYKDLGEIGQKILLSFIKTNKLDKSIEDETKLTFGCSGTYPAP